jgi:hypothetical protein
VELIKGQIRISDVRNNRLFSIVLNVHDSSFVSLLPGNKKYHPGDRLDLNRYGFRAHNGAVSSYIVIGKGSLRGKMKLDAERDEIDKIFMADPGKIAIHVLAPRSVVAVSDVPISVRERDANVSYHALVLMIEYVAM